MAVDAISASAIPKLNFSEYLSRSVYVSLDISSFNSKISILPINSLLILFNIQNLIFC